MEYLQLLPTGGINVDNFTDFLEAGATALGMGGQLFPKQLIAEGAWDELDAHFKKLVKRYEAFKKSYHP
jgi:2-dehydro-3-deoxyphosphogluconate aldolase/(4S)-4-hydroxy-2-oxoglutarate aldolase